MPILNAVIQVGTANEREYPDSPWTSGAWCEVVDQSPVPTLVVAGAESQVPGNIIYSNGAGRRMFGLRPDPVCDDMSILGLLDEGTGTLLYELFQSIDLDAPAEIRNASVRNHATPPRGEAPLTRGKRSTALLLQALSTGEVVVQFVDSGGWQAVDRVLDEQQRFRSALMELNELAHKTRDDEEFYQRLIERAVEVVPGAQGGSILLNIAGTTAFRFVAAVGYSLDGLQEYDLDQNHFFRDTEDPSARVVRSFDNTERTPVITEWLERVGRLSEIVVNTSAPVNVDGSPVAFLSLDNFQDPNALTETSVEMTTVLASFIGDLWVRRRLEAEVRKEREALRHLAMHDSLTGLANRRALDRYVNERLIEGRHRQGSTAVLFFDIDDFKGVNDRLGHEVGDLLLVAVARTLAELLGGSAKVGRWGGDEFLVLPTYVRTSDEAVALARRVLSEFEQALVLDEGVTYRARLSVGVGWSATSHVAATELVRTADAALYAAKAAGKGLARLKLI